MRFVDNTSEVDDNNGYCNPKTRIIIEKLCTSEKEKELYLQGNAHKDAKK